MIAVLVYSPVGTSEKEACGRWTQARGGTRKLGGPGMGRSAGVTEQLCNSTTVRVLRYNHSNMQKKTIPECRYNHSMYS